jgi:hypothetical protein
MSPANLLHLPRDLQPSEQGQTTISLTIFVPVPLRQIWAARTFAALLYRRTYSLMGRLPSRHTPSENPGLKRVPGFLVGGCGVTLSQGWRPEQEICCLLAAPPRCGDTAATSVRRNKRGAIPPAQEVAERCGPGARLFVSLSRHPFHYATEGGRRTGKMQR